ncbi:MAG TPA: NAD(P)/FAD-dependent oxidoreductase [Chitinophagaceae bacterium]|jgi:NADH dehydrogenase|nr:NAD(P)/FAD-dependent oxidoreductase [Chitinophagaceae bacterium]
MILPNIPDSPHPRVVIIGAGFAGINLVRALRKKPFQVVVINQNNYHLFQPLLYQVAMAGLEASSIAFPVRGIFSHMENFVFRMAEVQRIKTDEHTIETSIGEIKYDYLVIATGSTSNFFGNSHFEQYAHGMKSLYEAVGLRNFGLKGLEQALLLTDEHAKEKALTIVIVGGGPTGVELAGALAEFRKTVFPKDYPELSPELMTIHLIEGSPRLLAAMSPEASAHTLKYLTGMGVQIKLNTIAKDYDGETLSLSDGTTIDTKYFIWSAGVRGNAPVGLDGEVMERNARITVNEFNQVKGLRDVFAIGDVAQMTSDPRYPKGHPMLAQVAIQQGKNLGKNLSCLHRNLPMTAFIYKDKGTMSTIGRNKAVADIGKLHLTGFFAWITWMVVHLMFLMGFRNKLIVFINWVYSYFTYDRGARILLKRH